MTEKSGGMTPDQLAKKLRANVEAIREAIRQADSSGQARFRFRNRWYFFKKEGRKWLIYEHSPRAVRSDDRFSERARQLSSKDAQSEAFDRVERQAAIKKSIKNSPEHLDAEIGQVAEFLSDVWQAEAKMRAHTNLAAPTHLDTFQYEFSSQRTGPRYNRHIPPVANPNPLLSKLATAYKFATLHETSVSITLTFDKQGGWQTELNEPLDQPRLANSLIGNARTEKIVEYWLYEIEAAIRGEMASVRPVSGFEDCLHCGALIQKPKGQDRLYCPDHQNDNQHRKWIKSWSAQLQLANKTNAAPVATGAEIVQRLRDLKCR